MDTFLDAFDLPKLIHNKNEIEAVIVSKKEKFRSG
jgi:hypothetical protein